MGDAPHHKRAIRFVWRLLRKTMHFARNRPFLKDYRGIANQLPDKFNLTSAITSAITTLPPPTPPYRRLLHLRALIWRKQLIKLLSSLRGCWFLALSNHRFGLLGGLLLYLCCAYLTVLYHLPRLYYLPLPRRLQSTYYSGSMRISSLLSHWRWPTSRAPSRWLPFVLVVGYIIRLEVDRWLHCLAGATIELSCVRGLRAFAS